MATLPQVGQDVTLIVDVETINEFELDPGDVGEIVEVDEDEVKVLVYVSYARGNSPYGMEHKDYFYVPVPELADYFEEFEADENDD